MPNKRNLALILLISLTVVASGCVENGDNGEVETNPVAISDFYPAQSTIPADTNLALNVEIENSGDTDAENPALRLSGPTFSEDDDDSSAWRKQGPESMYDRPDRTFEINDIRSSEDEPITTVETITLVTPSYAEGRAPTESFDVELFYGYETQASTQVTAMTEEASVEEAGESSAPEVDNNSGPLQMEVLSRSPIVHHPGAGPDSCGLEVMVRNEGPGTPFSLDESYDEGSEDRYLVESDHENIIELEVEGQSPFEGETKEVELVNGEARACFEWPTDEDLAQEEQSVNIDMVASYGYHTEQQTSVTVEGRPGLDTGTSDENGQEDETTEWVFTDEYSENDAEVIEEGGWNIDDASDPAEVCPVLEDDDTDSAQDIFDEICGEE